MDCSPLGCPVLSSPSSEFQVFEFPALRVPPASSPSSEFPISRVSYPSESPVFLSLLKLTSSESVMPSTHLSSVTAFSSCPQFSPASVHLPMSQMRGLGLDPSYLDIKGTARGSSKKRQNRRHTHSRLGAKQKPPSGDRLAGNLLSSRFFFFTVSSKDQECSLNSAHVRVTPLWRRQHSEGNSTRVDSTICRSSEVSREARGPAPWRPRGSAEA